MKKGIIISTILVLILAGIAFSHGWKGSSGGWRGGYGGGWGVGLFPIVWLSLENKEELGLDQGQISALEKLQADFRAYSEARRGEMQALGEGLKTDVEQNNLAGAEEKIRKMGDFRTDLLIERLKAFMEAKKILTSAQYDKLLETIKSKWGSRGS